MDSDLSRSFAEDLDNRDPLASFRARFVIADPGLIYLDGNSLGRLTRASAERVNHLVEQEWGRGLIRGWNENWWEAPVRVGEKIARLVGAAPGQVVACDTVSVNLFKLAAAALAMRPDRPRIVTDTLNFPSDLYILQGLVHLLSPSPRPPSPLGGEVGSFPRPPSPFGGEVGSFPRPPSPFGGEVGILSSAPLPLRGRGWG